MQPPTSDVEYDVSSITESIRTLTEFASFRSSLKSPTMIKTKTVLSHWTQSHSSLMDSLVTFSLWMLIQQFQQPLQPQFNRPQSRQFVSRPKAFNTVSQKGSISAEINCDFTHGFCHFTPMTSGNANGLKWTRIQGQEMIDHGWASFIDTTPQIPPELELQ